MKNTTAKDTSRNLFYRFVQESFNKAELKSARAVVLLGKEMLEIPFLDKLGIARHHITCIEEDRLIYQDLHLWNRRQSSKNSIELYGGELNDYLRFLVDREQKVEIFNLDICGSLQNNIFPRFENVIKLSNQQPKTVIGTYLSAARDAGVLVNAIQQTAWLLLFDPEFKTVIEKLVCYFETVGYDKQIAFTHTFRLMQWVYEMVRIMIQVNHPNRAKMTSLGRVPQGIWELAYNGHKTMTWDRFVRAIESQSPISSKIKNLEFETAPTKLFFLAYRSEKFTQLCHFVKMETKGPIKLERIIKVMISGLMEFRFAEKDSGNIIIPPESKVESNFGSTVIMPKLSSNKLKKIKSVRGLKVPLTKLSTRPTKKQDSEPTADKLVMPALPPKYALWTKKTGFTKRGINFIKELGVLNPKIQVAELAKFFPKAAPKRSLSAYLAHSHRSK